DDPGFAGEAVHLHRKAHRWIDRPNAALLERRHDPARRFVDVIACVVKFEVGDGPRRTANRLTIHPADQADERFGPWKKAQDIVSLIGKLRTVDLDETDVVGPGLKTQLAEPLRIKTWRRHPVSRRVRSFLKQFNCRMFRK